MTERMVVVKGYYSSWEIWLEKTREKKDGTQETYLKFWKNPGNLRQLAASLLQTQTREGVVYYDTESIIAAIEEAEARVLSEINRWISESGNKLEMEYEE